MNWGKIKLEIEFQSLFDQEIERNLSSRQTTFSIKLKTALIKVYYDFLLINTSDAFVCRETESSMSLFTFCVTQMNCSWKHYVKAFNLLWIESVHLMSNLPNSPPSKSIDFWLLCNIIVHVNPICVTWLTSLNLCFKSHIRFDQSFHLKLESFDFEFVCFPQISMEFKWQRVS